MLARNLPGICPAFARHSLGIRPEFVRNSEFARNLLGKQPGPAMRGTLQPREKLMNQGRRNSITGFPADIPDPYAWTPLGQKVSPRHRRRRKTHFLVRTSTIFGADVHDPKGSRKTLYKKSLRRFFPYNEGKTHPKKHPPK